jgi:fatty-acyl-CoA synthase
VPHGRGDEKALLDWAKQHLAAYKLPRKVSFVDHLPRTKNGKLLRRELPHSLEQTGGVDP